MTASPDRAATDADMPAGEPDGEPDGNPSRRVEAAFAHIAATRMQGLPYLNPCLTVAAVGFRPWQARWIGVLVTPWGINLLQLPAPDAPFAPWRADQPIAVELPGATLSFMPARLDGLGDYRLCPLFSPARQFADQESALATAREVLKLLFVPDAAASSGAPGVATPSAPDPGRRKLFGLRP